MKEKKKKIIYTLLIIIASIMVSLCLFAKNEFGSPKFEQILFSFLLSKGSSIGVIVSGVFYCIPVVALFLLCFLPFIYIDLEKYKLSFISFYKGLYVTLVFGGSLVYALCSIGFFSYIFSQMQNTSFFEDYYVDPKDVSIVFPKEKKNLIYIAVESLESSYASAYVDKKSVNLIPELYLLAKDNINFSGNDDVGGAVSVPLTTWTAAGTVAQLSGLPIKTPLYNLSYGKDEKFLPGAIMIGDILEKEGYKNYYLSGGDAAFAASDILFSSHGNYEVLDYKWAINEHLIPEDYYEFWGFEDKKLYSFAKYKLLEISKNDEPFNLFMATIDTHVVDGYLDESCDNKYHYQYGSVITCADTMLSEFISWLREQDFYKDTIIIITGDHITMQTDIASHLEDKTNRSIYNVIINSSVVPEKSKNRLFTTMDMFPTTLASLGAKIEGDKLGLGTNLFSEKETLLEIVGINDFNKEIVKDSKYYVDKFMK